MVIDYFKYCELVEQLTNWAVEYDLGNYTAPSDVVYDELYKQIKQFEKVNPLMILKNSPTMKVGAAVKTDDGLVKVEHDHKMLSIANINSSDELREWISDKVSKGITEIILEYKIDGLSMSLKYDDGELDDAVSRGDGTTGERVLANAMQIPSVPKSISVKGKHEFRGEVVWMNEHFLAYNDEQTALGKKTMVNPRNGAAGTMRLLDPVEVGRRKLNFIGYRHLVGSEAGTQSADLDFMKTVGFETSPYWVMPISNDPVVVDAVVDQVAFMDSERKKLPYITDGLVIKVNDKSTYTMLGGTSKTPHAYGAYKFPPEVGTTPLVSVDNSSGKTGAVTPVANVTTIMLSLTSVSRASVHNWDMFEFMGFYEGCSVNIRKAGEIIPEIISVLGFEARGKDVYEAIKKNTPIGIIESIMRIYATDENEIARMLDIITTCTVNGKINLKQIVDVLNGRTDKPYIKRPTECKHCGATLRNDVNHMGEDLVALICPNAKCPSLQTKLMEAFVSKDCMNIMNVGDSTVELLIDTGLLTSFTDFYELTQDKLVATGRVSKREAERIMDGINATRSNYLNQLLNALGIEDIGRTASAELADHFATLSAINDAVFNNPIEIESVGKVGVVAANNLIAWFKVNQDVVKYFIANSIGVQAKKKLVTGDALVGMLMIMTGKSNLVGRDEFKTLVVQYGGKVASSISGKVSHVVLCDGAGPSKVKQIQEIQREGGKIKTITDEEFLKMIGR